MSERDPEVAEALGYLRANSRARARTIHKYIVSLEMKIKLAREQCHNEELEPGEAASSECLVCGALDCPYGEPLHYHHDGCPACD